MAQIIGYFNENFGGGHTQARLTADDAFCPVLSDNQKITGIKATCDLDAVMDVAIYDVTGITTTSGFLNAPRLALLRGS